ncbi:MAG TPA: hypothetical protein VL360_05425 [Gammaproteobacteria bacterium]|jgi:hypothetical protein|nr:hypothetical protein [Gammaproteobacteria bacterium]
MSLARFSLFKLADGAAVGAIGATLVNAAAYLIGIEGIDISEVAIVLAIGSLAYGIAREEYDLAKTPDETIKFSLAKDVGEKYKHHSVLSRFAAKTGVNITGNAISTVPRVIELALYGLLNKGNSEFCYGVSTLALSVIAGSAIETIYQDSIPKFKF